MRLSVILAVLTSIAGLLAFPSQPRTTSGTVIEERGATKSYCPGHPATESYQRELFFAFVHELYVVKDVISAFNTYVSLNLTEHDPFSPQGRVANENLLAPIIPNVPTTVLRMNFDNNIGLVHVKINEAGNLPTALADIFRMRGTCIVEHWDVTQETPANATNPIAMF